MANATAPTPVKQDRTRATAIGLRQDPNFGVPAKKGLHYYLHIVEKGMEEFHKSVDEMVAMGYTIEREVVKDGKWLLSIPEDRYLEHERAGHELSAEWESKPKDDHDVYTTLPYKGTRLALSDVHEGSKAFADATNMNG